MLTLTLRTLDMQGWGEYFITPGDIPRKCHSLIPALTWNFYTGDRNLAGSLHINQGTWR